MKIMNALTIAVSISLVLPNLVFADRGSVKSAVTPENAALYTPPTTTTTTMPPTLKELGQQSSSNNNYGWVLGAAMAAYTGHEALRACSDEEPSCPWWVTAFGASTAVTYNMWQAKNQSDATVAAVNTHTDSIDPNNPLYNGLANGSSSPPKIGNDGDWKPIASIKKSLEDKGWKFDLNKNTVTSPQGKTLNSGKIMSSPASMAAAGASSDMIKQYENMANKAAAKAKDQAGKATDNSTSMFADDGGGGGGGAKKVSADLQAGMGNFPSLKESKIGINRDPAQVAGMKKDYNGNPIGVAGDSLFDMVDRRYQLHQQNGSFLTP